MKFELLAQGLKFNMFVLWDYKLDIYGSLSFRSSYVERRLALNRHYKPTESTETGSVWRRC